MMDFTEKEMELAKKLKEDGLKWKPQEGDWYVNNGVVVLLTGMTSVMWNGYESLPIENKIWLPLWHQCRKILQDTGWRHFHMIHNIGCQNGQITVGAERNTKLLRGKGDTDLEAIYQAIGGGNFKMQKKCVNFEICRSIHPTGIGLLADGWGLQGKLGAGFKTICPECLEKESEAKEKMKSLNEFNKEV